jgi:hypothetical protein
MLTDFWTGIGGKLAERWATLLLSPAFAFWAGALAAWAWRYGRARASRQGWISILQAWADDLRGLSPVVQAALVVGLLLGIALSGVLVQAASPPVLRWLEGYWPSWLDPLGRWRMRRHNSKLDRDMRRLRELAVKGVDRLSADELALYLRLDHRRRRVPTRPERRMPTRLGNVLRAAEGRPDAHYGLEATICWPRLWLLLPDGARTEVGAARSSLNIATQVWLWGVLFVIWSVWAWWALPLGVLVAVGAYLQMIRSASVFGDLIESCFDLYRWLLYDSLRWPPPANPAEERQCGRDLTRYLWRGSAQEAPTFTGTTGQEGSKYPPARRALRPRAAGRERAGMLRRNRRYPPAGGR